MSTEDRIYVEIKEKEYEEPNPKEHKRFSKYTKPELVTTILTLERGEVSQSEYNRLMKYQKYVLCNILARNHQEAKVINAVIFKNKPKTTLSQTGTTPSNFEDLIEAQIILERRYTKAQLISAIENAGGVVENPASKRKSWLARQIVENYPNAAVGITETTEERYNRIHPGKFNNDPTEGQGLVIFSIFFAAIILILILIAVL